MRELSRHLMERWHDLVRSQWDLGISVSTNRLEGWIGCFKPRTWLARGLKTETGTLDFVHLMAHAMA